MTLLYVVQRCWHSGPIQHVPVDMLRLFFNQREAEEAAYHSALAFQKTNRKNNSESSVKTLLLPSYPSHNPQGSSYGFLANGGLFWVRALNLTVVAEGLDTNNRSGMCHSAAYAILTEGVVGGTGNRNSRRGTEVCDGRVFGGDATARAMAVEAVNRVRTSLTNPSVVVEVRTVPVGKPATWLSTGAFSEDWPEQAGLGNHNNSDVPMTGIPFGTTPKRQIGAFESMSNSNSNTAAAAATTTTLWGRSISRTEMDEDVNSISCSESTVTESGTVFGSNGEASLVVDCPFEEPVAKRRRVISMCDDTGYHAMMIS